MNKSRDGKSNSSNAINEGASDSVTGKTTSNLASRLLNFKKARSPSPIKPLMFQKKLPQKNGIPRLKLSTKDLKKKGSFDFDSSETEQSNSSNLS